MPLPFDQNYSEVIPIDQWQQQQTAPSDVPITPPGPTRFNADVQPDTNAVAQRVGASLQGMQAPNDHGGDWLSRVGNVLGATFVPGIIDKVKQWDQQKRQEENQQFDHIPKFLSILKDLQDNLPDSAKPGMAKKMTDAAKTLNLPFDEPTINEYMSNGSTSLEQFTNGIAFAKRLPENIRRQVYQTWRKNPAAGEKQIADHALNAGTQYVQQGLQVPVDVKNAMYGETAKRFQDTAGGAIFNQVADMAQKDPSIKDLSMAELRRKIPNFDVLTTSSNDTFLFGLNQLGFKNVETKAISEAKAKISSSPVTMSQIEAKAVLAKVTDPITGKIDDTKLFDIIKEMKTNPQGPEGRIFDYFLKQNKGNEDKAIKDFRGYLNSAASDRSSGNVTGREKGYQSVINNRLDRISKETSAAAVGRPLEPADRSAISAMRQTVRVAAQIKDEFTPEEIDKYVGVLKKPAREISQVVNKDPKFARLNTLINTIKGTAFAEGGKQLTPFEASITFGHIPTGTEFSTVDFLTKLYTTIEQTSNLIEDRINLATRPRRQGLPGQPGSKELDAVTAGKFLQQSGGDRNKARKLATDAGYKIPTE